jgi:hypothetical protein
MDRLGQTAGMWGRGLAIGLFVAPAPTGGYAADFAFFVKGRM